MLCALQAPYPDLKIPEVTLPEPKEDLSDETSGILTDHDLMARLTAEPSDAIGACEALSELYDRHASLLLALALRILHNRSDAEEIVQEVFFYAWRKAASYQPSRASVSSWLVIITRSRSLDRLRSRRRAEAMRSEVERWEPAPQTVSSEGYSQVLKGERAVRVRRALARLPAAQRQVLEFSYYLGWTQKEVAERTGLPIGTVKTRTFLALKKLRRELADDLALLM